MDIIFFAAIALFIAFKLKENLGKISDSDKEQIVKRARERQEKIIALQKNNNFSQEKNDLEVSKKDEIAKSMQNDKNQEFLQNLSEESKKEVQEILEKSNSKIEEFIEGAKLAFEMVLKAFSQEDKPTLQFLLGEKTYQNFEKSIDARKSENKKLNTNLISIEKIFVKSSSIHDNNAILSLEIHSKQINYFTNEKDEVIEGSKEEISKLEDIWTFKKDLSDNNPNWKISATG